MTGLQARPQGFKARLFWELEKAQLQKEQDEDLKTPALDWWQPRQQTEAGYFDSLAETNGKTGVFYG